MFFLNMICVLRKRFYICTPIRDNRKAKRGLSSAGSEHLPYKQRVTGSNPVAPTKKEPRESGAFLFKGISILNNFDFSLLRVISLNL